MCGEEGEEAGRVERLCRGEHTRFGSVGDESASGFDGDQCGEAVGVMPLDEPAGCMAVAADGVDEVAARAAVQWG
jgi:hypothetical protein